MPYQSNYKEGSLYKSVVANREKKNKDILKRVVSDKDAFRSNINGIDNLLNNAGVQRTEPDKNFHSSNFERQQARANSIAKNPNIPKAQKESEINKIFSGLDAQTNADNRQYYQNQYDNAIRWGQEHPYASFARMMADPTYLADINLKKQLLDYEGDIPTKQKILGTIQRGGMGGATFGQYAIGGGVGALARNAGSNVAAKAATASAIRTALPRATAGIGLTTAEKLAPVLPKALNIGAAGVGGGGIAGNLTAQQYFNGQAELSDIPKEIAKWGAISSLTGALSPVVGGITGKLGNAVTKSASKTLEKNPLISNQAKYIAKKEMQRRAAQGIKVTSEMADEFAANAEKNISSRISNILGSSASGLGTSAIDTQVMANSDYLLNNALEYMNRDNKNEQYWKDYVLDKDKYLEEQKAFAPYNFLGVINPVAKYVASPLAERGVNKLGEKHPGVASEVGNALNMNLEGKAKRYQQAKRALMDASAPSEDYLTYDQHQQIKRAGELSQEQGSALQEEFRKGKKPQKRKTKAQKAEEFMNDAPSISVELPKENKATTSQERPLTNENTSSGINTPKEDLTAVKPTSHDVSDNITRIPTVDKVAEGGKYDNFTSGKDETITDVNKVSETQAIYDDNLTVENKTLKNRFDEWKTSDYDSAMSDKTREGAIESMRFALNEEGNKEGAKAFEKYLKDNKISDAPVKNEFTSKEQAGALKAWYNVAAKLGHSNKLPSQKTPEAVKKFIDRAVNSQKGYDRVLSEIETLSKATDYGTKKPFSDRVKMAMVDFLNNTVSENNKNIKTRTLSNEDISNARLRKLQNALDKGDINKAESIGAEYLAKRNNVVEDLYSSVVDKAIKEIDSAIKNKNFTKAQNLLDKYSKAIKMDTLNAHGKEVFEWKEVSEGTQSDNIVITDSHGRTYELTPTGTTYEGLDATEAMRAANKRVSDIQKQINDAQGIKYEPKEKTKEEIVKNNVNKFLYDLKKNNVEHVDTSLGNYIDSYKPYQNETGTFTRLDEEFAQQFEQLNNEGVDFSNVRTVEFRDEGFWTGGSESFYVPETKTLIIKKGTDKKNIIHETRHIGDYSILDRPENAHLKKFFDKYMDAFYHPSQQLVMDELLKTEVSGHLSKIKDIDPKIIVDMYDLSKPSKYIEPQLPSEFLKKIEKYDSIIDTISDSRHSKQDIIDALYLDNAARYYSEKNLLEVRADRFSEGLPIGDFINEAKEFVKGELEEITKQSGNSTSFQSSRARRYMQGKIPKTTSGIFGIYKRTSKRRKPGEIIEPGKDYTPDVDVPSANDIKKQWVNDAHKIYSQQEVRNLQKISSNTENTFKKLGILTEGQIKNRKAQLGSDVKYYDPQIHTPTGKEKIERGYYENTKRDTLFGKAIKGVNSKVTMQDTVRNTFERAVTAKFLEEENAIRKEMSIKVGKDGSVPDGYVAVNDALMNNVVARRMSKRFIDKFNKGEEAIREMFDNKEQQDFFVELYNRTRKADYAIPKDYYDMLFSFENELSEEAFRRYGMDKGGKWYATKKRIGEMNDALLDIFKRGVLSSSGFFVHNRIGNTSLLLADADNPGQLAKNAVKAIFLRDDMVPQRLIENSLTKESGKAMYKRKYTGNATIDDIVNLFNGEVIKQETTDRILNTEWVKKDLPNGGHINVEKTNYKKLNPLERTGNILATPARLYKHLSRKVQQFNQKFEDYERKIAFLNEVDRATKMKKLGQQVITTGEAVKAIRNYPELENVIVNNVENVLGNYRTFTPLEKNVAKKFVPFYSWIRTLTRETYHIAKNNPHRLALILKEMSTIKDRNEDLKDFQKLSFEIPVKDPRTKQNLRINLGRYMFPWEDIVEFAKNGGSLNDFMGGFNPFYKSLMEAIAGKKFFASGVINSRKYTPTSKYDVKQKKYVSTGYRDVDTGEQYEALPASERAKYFAKQSYNYLFPYLSDANSSLKAESTIAALKNMRKNGEYKEPDKMSDTDWFTGWDAGEKTGKYDNPKGRYSGNTTSQATRFVNRLGLGLQQPYYLNNSEKAKLAEKQKRYKNKKKKNK